jgi:hypothetical protein
MVGMKVATVRYVLGAWSAPFPRWDSAQTLVLVFGASEMGKRKELFARLAAEYPRSCLMGCSTAGEIEHGRIWDDSMTVAIVKFDRTAIRRAYAVVEDAGDSFEAGGELAMQLGERDLRAVFVLSTGTDVNGSELVRGINAKLPSDVVVTGGLAGDGERFGETWVMANGVTSPGAAVAIGLYGDALRVSCGNQGGWDSAGVEAVVTRAEGNVVYELDGEPALQRYRAWLGGNRPIEFPLSLDGVVRTVLGVDEATQSLVCAADVRVGTKARLVTASSDRLIFGAHVAGGAAVAEHAGPTLALAVSGIGRRLVLGERAEEEVRATLQRLPLGTQQIGFYAYGELAPTACGRSDLHNQMMTLTVLSEA